MKRLNLTTVEQAKELAKTISETAQRPAGSEKPLEVDSGVTSGGGKLTNEQLDKLSMDDYAAHRKKETSS